MSVFIYKKALLILFGTIKMVLINLFWLVLIVLSFVERNFWSNREIVGLPSFGRPCRLQEHNGSFWMVKTYNNCRSMLCNISSERKISMPRLNCTPRKVHTCSIGVPFTCYFWVLWKGANPFLNAQIMPRNKTCPGLPFLELILQEQVEVQL